MISNTERREALQSCPLFQNIEEAHIEKMLLCLGARIKTFDKKETVISAGEPATNIGILLTGSVKIISTDYYGNRSIVSTAKAPELFAEDFACAEAYEMPVSVIADEPCDVLLLNCSHILHTCRHNCAFHQQMIFNLMKDIATKNLAFHQKIEITSKRTTREKLIAYLLSCAKEYGQNSFSVPFDRQELADYLEVERSGLSAEIGKMKREGLIDCKKSNFKLLGNRLYNYR